MRVLIAEDDLHTRNGLAEILAAEGYEPLLAADGRAALALFEQQRPDFVCLDIMMPGRSGYEVCRQIRGASASVPIIFISAKSEEIDKVLGLELGADDFIVKPFGVSEVVARIRAVTRRCLQQRGPASSATSFRMDDLQVLPAELRARRDEQTFELSLREVKLLELLWRHQGQVMDRGRIFDHCWGLHHVPNSRTLDQTVSQLRKRIERDPKAPRIVQTVHGVGYRYEDPR